MAAPKILISAGEASSDMYAARLAKALRERTGAQFFGMGGPRMAEAGVELIADYHEVAVVGIAEVLHKIPTVIKVQNRLAREARKRGAESCHSGRLARHASRRRAPPEKLRHSRRIFRRTAGLGLARRTRARGQAPGETHRRDFSLRGKNLSRRGRPVNFVGHPLVDVVHATMTRDEFAAQLRPRSLAPIVTLLPGSRRGEIARHYGTVIEACERLHRSLPNRGIQFVHAVAPNLKPETLAAFAKLPSKSNAWNPIPTTRWPPRIAPSSPAAPPPSKPHCSARPWWSFIESHPSPLEFSAICSAPLLSAWST